MEESVPKKSIETNYMLFIIPSWGNLLGFPTMGKYVNQDVLRITSDPVIFFSSKDISIASNDGGTLYYLFGLGSYDLRFELESGKHIFERKELSCLILSDFVYDFMAISPNIALENDRNFVINENCIRIPLQMEASDTQKAFIQGILTRNVFVPYKEPIIQLINRIKDLDSYRILDRGHLILSTYWNDFNKILVSEKFRNNQIDGYLNSTPGLNEITFKADEYLSMFSLDELDQINDDLSTLKTTYQNLEYDPGFLSSILENAAKKLTSPLHPVFANDDNIDDKIRKNVIFISAQDRIYSVVPWSSNFVRKEKKDVVKDTTTQEVRITPGMKSIVRLSNVDDENSSQSIEPIQIEEEKFVLKSLKHRKVESKTLPNPPEGDIEKILLYMRTVIEEDYEMVAIGKAFELARDNIRKIILQSDFMWEMSKYSNTYQRKEPNQSLNERDRSELLEKIDKWISDMKEEKRLEQERLEKIRKEKERIEREKAEKERLDKKQREIESLDPKQRKKLEKEQKKLQKRKEKEHKKQEKERKKLEKKKLKEQKKKK